MEPSVGTLRIHVLMSANRSQASLKKLHVILAMGFLFVMLVEWGSHSLAFAHSGYSAGMTSVNAREDKHDDPCRTMTDCCQSRKHGGMVVSPSHHLPSFNSFVETIAFKPANSREIAVEPEPRDDARRIHRPKDPLLHPPELS